MTSTEQVERDLRYVRGAVESSERHPTPPSIYLVWALICILGFPLVDFAPRRVGLYWMIAAPLGMIASALLGRRDAQRQGQLSHREGRRHGLHWLSLLVAFLLASVLPATGRIDGEAMGQVGLLLIAVVYFLAGVHLDPALLWVSGLIAAGYLALFVLPAWGWTAVGATLATALVLCAWIARRRRVGAPA